MLESKISRSAGADAADISIKAAAAPPLEVRIKLVHGGLTNVTTEVAVGARYDGLAFAGPTKVFDHVLDSWLTRAVDLGIIGSALGQLMPINLADFHKADKLKARTLLLAGMGEPGRFAQDGVRFIFSNIIVTIKAIGAGEFATPLLGTRRNELPIGDAVRGLVQGICDGYERACAIADSVTEAREAFQAVVQAPLTVKLAHEDKQKLDRIRAALGEIGVLPNITLHLDDEDIVVDPDPILESTRADIEPAPPITYLRVTQSQSAAVSLARAKSAEPAKRKKPTKAIDQFPTDVFQFSALSDVAVVPQREQEVNAHLLRDLADEMTNVCEQASREDLTPAQRLAQAAEERQEQGDFFTTLVIPEDFRKLIEGPASVTLEVDNTTALYPWEMAGYEKFAGEPLFLGTNVAISRQFRTVLAPPPTSPPALNGKLKALVIADPAAGPLRLPGARREGKAVVEVLQKAQDVWGDQYEIEVTLRMGSKDEGAIPELDQARKHGVVKCARSCDSLELAKLLVRKQYDLVHYAGHGFCDPKTGQTGWVFAADCVLSAKEIFRVRQVPRLVFANACYSAVTGDNRQTQRGHMTGLAQAFFGRGIPNYIGAGWEVDDDCAVTCAKWFYAGLLGLTDPDGSGLALDPLDSTIGRALRTARRKAQESDPASSSWGAYQHYGHVDDRLVAVANPQSVAVTAVAAAPSIAPAGPAPSAAPAPAKPATKVSIMSTSTPADDDPNLVYVNGINANTGQYAVPPRSIDDIASQVSKNHGADTFSDTRKEATRFALPPGKTESVKDVGWGIIFPADTAQPIRDALKPLMDLRGKQGGTLVKELDYRPGEQVRQWLARNGVSPGTLLPRKVPYYLLLVGSPEQIPYEFQYLLGVEYAVGRLAFDAAGDYEQYARSTIAYEGGRSVPNAKKISYWGTRHLGDGATRLSSTFLLDPLINGIADDGVDPINKLASVDQELFLAKNATKANLLATLHAARPPALLFTASHGMQFNAGQAEQAAGQGALLCQDWPGFGDVKPEHYLTAADIADDANVSGMVAFLFACFGAGTPDKDQFLKDLSQAADAPALAPEPFIAALPRRLLAHPKGSALAVIGHIDRAWGFSMQSPSVSTPQIGTFEGSLGEMLSGKPIGHVMCTRFGARYADLSAILLSATSPTASAGDRLADRDLVGSWLERNDAQNYVLLGDPAVRIRNDILT
ncbi:MAG: CHAT domain-containing protein [Bradyrhizobium sp.]|uniref:CHAT domain-containing protein n=1 Tax=Bradyrhizobium sp. TaxID=376 RepID=UPI001D37238B|nr:CHAT domain-containing protein [Bradyrhizobium sp.]MBV9560419.1 CHAT domain-containing protein [Bradyrhizobium sp.]